VGAIAPGHLIVLLVIILLLFWAKRLPEIARGMGEALRGFKDSLAGHDEDGHDEPPAPPPASSSGTSASDRQAADGGAARPASPAATGQVAHKERAGRDAPS